LIASTFDILDRQNNSHSLVTDIRNDFRLGEIGQLPVNKTLENPHITLYGLDFENRWAVFVETRAVPYGVTDSRRRNNSVVMTSMFTFDVGQHHLLVLENRTVESPNENVAYIFKLLKKWLSYIVIIH
jgi:hypothetical protein